MRPVWRLAWKEIRELLRPKYILPILFVPLIFVAMAGGIGGVEETLEQRPTVGVINGDEGDLGELVDATYRQGADVAYNRSDGDPEAALETVRAAGGSTVVVIPANFTERIRAGERGGIRLYTAVESVSITGIAASSRAEGLLEGAARAITREVTGASATQLDPVRRSSVTFVKGERLAVAPGALAAAFSTQFLLIPLLIMFVILLSGQMVVNSMGMEKEHKTLETLLTMPVPRRTIVAGKLIGSSAIGLLAAGLYTGSIVYYQQEIGVGGGAAHAFQLGGLEYALIGISLFLALLGGLALMLCLGVFVEDRQAAQLLVVPLGMLVFAPLILTLIADIQTVGLPLQVLALLIPFTTPIIAPKQLLFGDPTIVLVGIAYQILFAGGAILLAIHLFESDRLVTGSTGKLGQYVERLQR